MEGEPKTTMQKLVGLEAKFSRIEEVEVNEEVREELQLIQSQLAEFEPEIKEKFGDPKMGGQMVMDRFNDLKTKIETKLSPAE